MDYSSSLPQSDRSTSTAAGHWVLARAGKRVLRPGGLKLTKRMLSAADMQGKEIVEFAPGLGRTAQLIVTEGVSSYVGVDQDSAAVARVEAIVKPHGGTVINAKAQDTGLSGESAEVVVGEAMLTMQGEKPKPKSLPRHSASSNQAVITPSTSLASPQMTLTQSWLMGYASN